MAKQDVYALSDVFGVSRDVPANYMERPTVDGRLVDALSQNKHIVVHGSSKQGKTCLRKYTLLDRDYLLTICSNKWTLRDLHGAILKAAGYQIEASTTKTLAGDFKVRADLKGSIKVPLVGELGGGGGTELVHSEGETTTTHLLDLDLSDVNDVIAALDAAGAPPYIVLEDFHYLPDEVQRDFAVALKAFHEQSPYCFIIVGVWLDENRLIQHNGDLSGRVISINADLWKREELVAVIEEGARLLGISFDPNFVEALLDGAFESVWIVQEVCRQACEDSGVVETRRDGSVVSGDAIALIAQVVDQQSARFNGFIMNFAKGFQHTRLEMYRWLVFCVVTAEAADLERGLVLAEVSTMINAVHPETPINAGNIVQALHSTASLQIGHLSIKPIILDYDQTKRSLNVVDRGFLIWLLHQDVSTLMATAGIDFGDD